MKDIYWLDGKDAVGKYILEILFVKGTKSFMKNENYEKISDYYTLIFGCPDVAGVTLLSPDGKVIATKNKMATAA